MLQAHWCLHFYGLLEKAGLEKGNFAAFREEEKGKTRLMNEAKFPEIRKQKRAPANALRDHVDFNDNLRTMMPLI